MVKKRKEKKLKRGTTLERLRKNRIKYTRKEQENRLRNRSYKTQIKNAIKKLFTCNDIVSHIDLISTRPKDEINLNTKSVISYIKDKYQRIYSKRHQGNIIEIDLNDNDKKKEYLKDFTAVIYPKIVDIEKLINKISSKGIITKNVRIKQIRKIFRIFNVLLDGVKL